MAKTPIQIVPNLVQGVSQQAAQNRRDAQCEEQFDCVNSVLEGAAARPHADLVKLYAGRNLVGSLFSETSYGNDENYLTGVNASGQPFAIDLVDGTDCTVTNVAPNLSYLTAGALTPKDKLRAQVVDDFTFIANRQVTPAIAATLSPAKVNEALIFVRASAFNTTYAINLSGTGATSVAANYLTSSTVVAPTDTIAADLAADINAVTGWTATRSGSVIRVVRDNGAAFTITSSDGNGDDYLRVFYGECSSLSRLPQRAFNGMIIKVRGEAKTGADDYYVKFVGDPSTGSWQEVVGPGVKTTIDAATMPHALVLTNYRTFEFRRLAYGTRIAGDADTSPDPGFIGKPIRDMIYHQRRLGLIHPSGTVFSKSNSPFTYFPDTVQTVLATAPVDIKVSSGDKRGSSVLDFALQAQENLYLWAQRSQFRVSSGSDPFKQDTVEVLPSMSYQYALDAYPLPLGSFVFLASEIGSYASLRALLYSQTKLAGDVDVTSHVGQYITAGVTELTASETLRYIFIQTEGNKQVLYLFNYTYDGDQGFIQTGINTWRIPGGDILWCSLKDNYLRVLQQRPEGVALLRFDLTPQVRDPVAGAQYSTRLDLRVSEAGVSGLAYNSALGTSSFTLPYTPTGPELMVVTRADKAGGYTRGRKFSVVSVVGAVVTVKGDLTGYSFYVGQKITAERTESEFFLRGDQGAMPVDQMLVNRFFLSLAQSAYTRIEVITPNKDPKSYTFTGQTLGGSGAQTGTPIPKNGILQAPVGESAPNAKIRLVNDTFLPSYWQSAAYEYTAVGWAGAR